MRIVFESNLWYAITVITVLGISVGIIFDTYDVTAANNDSLTTKVNVTNTEPKVKIVELIPSSINLNPGGNTTINCTGTIWELNGAEGLIVNATLYDITEGSVGTSDNNFRYINQSCANCTDLISPNVSCTCQFTVEYYANNGTWQCSMTVMDEFNLTSTNTSNNATVNTVIGIDVPPEIDYGNLSVTETSDLIYTNVTNFGNIPINISVKGFGGDNESILNAGNYSMMCETGNISIKYERYSINNNTVYANMTNLTNTSTPIPNFRLPVRTNDSQLGNDTNTTYWRLQIPLNVGGFCNGTVIFSATQTTI